MIVIPDDERDLFDDVLGSGGIYRRTVRKAEDESSSHQAEYGEEVTVRYSEKILDTNVTVSDNQVRSFRIGDGEVMPALELISKMMKVGEICEIRCDSRFAYGDIGLTPYVPPNTSMCIILELVRVGKRTTVDMTSKELLEEATKKKESGNRFFKEKQYNQAAKLYKKALKLLESWERNGEEDEDETMECKQLLIALGNNVGNVQHRLQQYKEARESSLQVLQIDSTNIKAIYRIAQIALDTNEYEQAMLMLKQGLAIDPNNHKFREMIVQVNEKKAAHRERERQLYAKMVPTKPSPEAVDTPVEETKLVPWRQWLHTHIVTICTVVTCFIAFLIYVLIGKRYYD